MTKSNLKKLPKSMGESPGVATFMEIFSSIKDPRFARTRLHPLSSILMLWLCAVICGADTVIATERYGHHKIDFLTKLMPFPHGIPSHDTNARVLTKLNPMGLESCFAQLSDHEVSWPSMEKTFVDPGINIKGESLSTW